MTVAIVVGAGPAQRLLPVLGPNPFMVTGATLTGVGLSWLMFISSDSGYATGVPGPVVVFGSGMGLNFVTLTLTAVSGVAPHEAGAASDLLNATQRVGGSLGLSILVTAFGTAGREESGRQLPGFLAYSTPEQRAEALKAKELPAPWGHEVLTSGISSAFTATVGMVLIALVTAVLVTRARKSGLEALSGRAEAAGPGV